MKDCDKGLPWPVQNLMDQVFILIKKKRSDGSFPTELQVDLVRKSPCVVHSKQHRSLKLFLFFLFFPFPFLSLFSDIFLARTSLIRSKNTFGKTKGFIIAQYDKVIWKWKLVQKKKKNVKKNVLNKKKISWIKEKKTILFVVYLHSSNLPY